MYLHASPLSWLQVKEVCGGRFYVDFLSEAWPFRGPERAVDHQLVQGPLAAGGVHVHLLDCFPQICRLSWLPGPFIAVFIKGYLYEFGVLLLGVLLIKSRANCLVSTLGPRFFGNSIIWNRMPHRLPKRPLGRVGWGNLEESRLWAGEHHILKQAQHCEGCIRVSSMFRATARYSAFCARYVICTSCSPR